jgi:hypothetical protein
MTQQTDRELIQRLADALEVLHKEAVTTPHNQTIVVGGVAHPIPIGSDLIARDAIYAHLLDRARARLAEPEPQGPPLEPRGCPTPGACSCPTSPIVPPELIRALELAETALADIGDADRELGDDLAWAEARAAQDLLRIRRAIARWGRPAIKPVPVSERLPGGGAEEG